MRQFSNRSPTEFKVMQREELFAARMRDLVRARVRVGDDEAFTALPARKGDRHHSFRRPSGAIGSRSHVLDLSPAAVDAWAKEHKEEVDRVFEIAQIPVPAGVPHARGTFWSRLPDGASDEQKAAAETKIEAALERVKEGEDFAKVAAK